MRPTSQFTRIFVNPRASLLSSTSSNSTNIRQFSFQNKLKHKNILFKSLNSNKNWAGRYCLDKSQTRHYSSSTDSLEFTPLVRPVYLVLFYIFFNTIFYFLQSIFEPLFNTISPSFLAFFWFISLIFISFKVSFFLDVLFSRFPVLI